MLPSQHTNSVGGALTKTMLTGRSCAELLSTVESERENRSNEDLARPSQGFGGNRLAKRADRRSDQAIATDLSILPHGILGPIAPRNTSTDSTMIGWAGCREVYRIHTIED